MASAKFMDCTDAEAGDADVGEYVFRQKPALPMVGDMGKDIGARVAMEKKIAEMEQHDEFEAEQAAAIRKQDCQSQGSLVICLIMVCVCGCFVSCISVFNCMHAVLCRPPAQVEDCCGG